MLSQEELDDNLTDMFENFSENTHRIKFTIPEIIRQDLLIPPLLDVHKFFRHIHKVIFSKNIHPILGMTRQLLFVVSGKNYPILRTESDNREIKWVSGLIDSLQKELKENQNDHFIKYYEPFISNPEGFRPSCINVTARDAKTTEYILSAFFRKYESVKNPRLITVIGPNGKSLYYLKTNISYKKNTGYGDNPLSKEKSAIVAKITNQALQYIRKLELEAKQFRKRGKKL